MFCGVISDPICRNSNSRPSLLLSTWFLIPIPLALASPRLAQVVNQGSSGRWLGWAGQRRAGAARWLGSARPSAFRSLFGNQVPRFSLHV